MKLKPVLFLLTILIISSITAACQTSSSRDSVRKSDLVGTKWKLTKLLQNNEILPINSGADLSLEFRDLLIGGHSGCSNYQAGWKLGRDGRFELSGPIAQTRVGCLDSALSLENSFTAVLTGSHTLVLDGDILVIDSADGQLVFIDDK
ncbi:MAG: heat shock protein HslJ [Cellvibrionaceae bacterium]|jgi:heat shock protein HslJ